MSKPVLTIDHPSSSYGLPVLVIDGQAYGPADETPLGPAAEVVRATKGLDPAMVERFLAPLPPYPPARLCCYRCGHRWPPRGEDRPRICPKCKSPYWDRPRK